MGKLKGFFAVVLALALIIAGAYFPKAVSLFLDWTNTGNVYSNSIASIRFELDKDIPSIGKLAILGRYDGSIELGESKASMSRAEVMAAVYKGIQPYIDKNMMHYSEQEVHLYPCLIYVQDDKDLQNIVWFAEVTGDPANYTFLQVAVDDETGKILACSYTYEDNEGYIVGAEAIAVFADIFFTGLDIHDYKQAVVSDLEHAYVGENVHATRYRFGDAIYGEVNVDLYVHEHGFYVELSDEQTGGRYDKN